VFTDGQQQQKTNKKQNTKQNKTILINMNSRSVKITRIMYILRGHHGIPHNFDSDMSKSTNTVVYFDWKTVVYIYVCGQCRTQFMMPNSSRR
jgi:hypothetical protein